jgi:hypothetical protein
MSSQSSQWAPVLLPKTSKTSLGPVIFFSFYLELYKNKFVYFNLHIHLYSIIYNSPPLITPLILQWKCGLSWGDNLVVFEPNCFSKTWNMIYRYSFIYNLRLNAERHIIWYTYNCYSKFINNVRSVYGSLCLLQPTYSFVFHYIQ